MAKIFIFDGVTVQTSNMLAICNFDGNRFLFYFSFTLSDAAIKPPLYYFLKEFLSRKGFVHRDLAARNVLVCEGKLVKVADFGLSRNVYTEKVYHSTKSRKLPIKWMSPEAIHDQVFNAKSDV